MLHGLSGFFGDTEHVTILFGFPFVLAYWIALEAQAAMQASGEDKP